MRLLPALLLLLVLPGLLLPAGFVHSLCRCASAAGERGDASSTSCCTATEASCCAAPATADGDDDAGGLTARAHADCKCPVLATPERKADATTPDRSCDPSPRPLARMPEPFARAPVRYAPRNHDCDAICQPPPPDRARSLPLRL